MDGDDNDEDANRWRLLKRRTSTVKLRENDGREEDEPRVEGGKGY
jgi:hypothetical protein